MNKIDKKKRIIIENIKDLENIAKKRTLPVGYSDTAQNVELKLSTICR